jgi:hypothetical protein
VEVLEGRQDLDDVGQCLVDRDRVVLPVAFIRCLSRDFSEVPPMYSMTM